MEGKEMWGEKVTVSKQSMFTLVSGCERTACSSTKLQCSQPNESPVPGILCRFQLCIFLLLAAPSTLLSSWGHKVYAFWLTQTWLAQCTLILDIYCFVAITSYAFAWFNIKVRGVFTRHDHKNLYCFSFFPHSLMTHLNQHCKPIRAGRLIK